jgi:hypothetical protein
MGLRVGLLAVVLPAVHPSPGALVEQRLYLGLGTHCCGEAVDRRLYLGRGVSPECMSHSSSIDPEYCSDSCSGDSPEGVSGASLHMVRGMLSSSSSLRCSSLLSPMERTTASLNTTLRLLSTRRVAEFYTNHAGDSEAYPAKTPFHAPSSSFRR